MLVLARLVPNLLNSTCHFPAFTSRILQPVTANFHSLINGCISQVNPGGPFSISARTKVRVYFPRPSERKRIKRHGWNVRMSTPGGRRVIMNRILKGRFVYTH